AALNRKTKKIPRATDPTNPNQLRSSHTSDADSADTQRDPPIPRSPSPAPASAYSHQTPHKRSAPTAQNPISPSSPPPPPPAPSPAASCAHAHCPPRSDYADSANWKHQTAPNFPATSYNPRATPAH